MRPAKQFMHGILLNGVRRETIVRMTSEQGGCHAQDINSNEFVVNSLRGFWVLGRSFGDCHIAAICTDAVRNIVHFADTPS